MRNKQIAIAIFFGFALIALAIVLPKFSYLFQTRNSTNFERKTNEQHIYGSKEAPTKIVEFSDLECPFCERLHSTLKELVDDSNGQIVWEYRHLPLQSHQHSYEAALTSECVSRLKGETAFFAYLDQVFSRLGKLNSLEVNDIALQFGITQAELDICLADQTVKDKVDTDTVVAAREGAKGTPFSIIIGKTGKTKSVSGALPKVQWESLIELVNDGN